VEAAQTIERERRWATPAALISILAVVLFAVSLVMLASSYSAEGNAELLRKIDDDSSTFVLAYVIRALASLLLAVPLLYLFEAALARSDRMRRQFVGLTIAGPVFLAALAIFTALSLKDAAPDFVARGVMGTGDHADKVAENVIEGASLRGLAAGFGFAGAISFAIAMAYSCFQAMRVGLLTRFWGSLGAAIGAASILMGLILVIPFFVYLGLLIGGWTPRGRPPAWAAGEAIPWPTPGERAAESLQAEDTQSEEIGSTTGDVARDDQEGGEESDSGEPPQRRKRKRRR
jgi:hypothetical protein